MMQVIVGLKDADLLARMRNFEDHLVERKAVKDEKDWKRTAVVFANSVPVGLPAVLYIGVRDSGEIETPQKNLDEVQKKFNRQMEKVYPRIAYVPTIISDNGRQALAVIIPGSELRPHFAGPAYIRKGSVTEEASDQQFAELIAQRNSKAGKILARRNKTITVFDRTPRPMGGSVLTAWPDNTGVFDCNQFYVTLQIGADVPQSFPLNDVEINFDNAQGRLLLHIVR